MNPIEENKKVWDKMYAQNQGVLQYPSENFVRLVHRLLNEDDKKVLDWGFGSGNNLFPLLKMGKEMHGIEISQKAIELTQKRTSGFNLKLSQISDNKTNFPDNFFDAVVSWQVLYYNTKEELQKALQEIKRILKPNGKFIITINRKQDSITEFSEKIGDQTYKITDKFPSQQGAILFIPDNEEILKDLFGIFQEVNIGYIEYNLTDFIKSDWVIYGRA